MPTDDLAEAREIIAAAESWGQYAVALLERMRAWLAAHPAPEPGGQAAAEYPWFRGSIDEDLVRRIHALVSEQPAPASRPESGLRGERSEAGGDRAASVLAVPIGDTFKSSQEARDAG
jgi:hypothetical protein